MLRVRIRSGIGRASRVILYPNPTRNPHPNPNQVAPETLAARCRAALRTALRAGNAACCAELLVLLTRCEAPWLAPLAACVSECAAAQRPDVERACAAAGIRLDEALEALAKLPCPKKS